jgi:hypothetical protein
MVASGPLAGSGDDHLARAGLEVLGRVGAVGEAAGGLDHDLDPEVGPRQPAGSVSLVTRMRLPSTTRPAVGDLDRTRVDTVHRVVLEQMGEGLARR